MTVIFNYISALILIIPLFLISVRGQGLEHAASLTLISIENLPWYVISGGGLIGVFTTGVIAILLLKAPALMVIMGIYAG